MTPADWIPMEWPREWQRDLGRFDLLKGTPINCLLCQETLEDSFKSAAARAGLVCFSSADAPFSWRPLKEVDWRSKIPVIAIGDGVWPRIDLKRGNTSDSAGPTGAPWLDANGWVIQLARMRAGAKPVWIRAEPPAENEVMRVEDYLLAVSEAEVFGARRPLWLARTHTEQLAQGNASAKGEWDRLTQTLGFWEKHREWRSWPVTSSLLVVSTFSGVDEYMSTEMLNLSARRNLPFDPMEPGMVTPASLTGKKAVVYVDQAPMPPVTASAIRAWVQKGGLLIASEKPAFQIGGMKPLNEPHPRYFLHAAGQGRIAVPKQPWDDPWILAEDTHLIMSRRYDPVRLFNGGSLTYHQVTSPDGKRSVVHLLNYARTAAGHEVSLQIARPVKSATLTAPGAQGKALELQRQMGRQEVYLPPLPVYGAIELEHSV